MIHKLLCLTLAFAAASAVQGATTLQFSVSPNGATDFANAVGTATNGMLWGVVIDSTGNGFQGTGGGSYDAFNQNASGFLSVAGLATDDYYFFTGTSTQSLTGPFFTGVEAGAGGITTANNVPSTGDGVAGVNAADPFGLLWMATSTAAAGDKYGFFTTGTFLLPAAGVVNFSAAFAGDDPIRSASSTFAGAVVPEPSRLMLFGLAGLGVFFRRRRC